MENTKSDPIVIEQPGVRMTIAHRSGLGGSDEGLTFDVTTAGPEDEGKRILRFDCFYKNPHYHVGASGGDQAAHKMKDEGIEDPVRWTLEQLKTRFPSMVKQDGYEEVAERIDQQAITEQLTWLESEIEIQSHNAADDSKSEMLSMGRMSNGANTWEQASRLP